MAVTGEITVDNAFGFGNMIQLKNKMNYKSKVL